MAQKWTLMVYMAATDPQLSQRLEAELNDMRNGLSGQDVRVLAFIKQDDLIGTVTYVEVHPDGDRREGQEDKDAADPATVCEFVRWAHEKAPADRYGLILWGHGSGFRPDERPSVDAGVWQAARPVFFRRSVDWVTDAALATAETTGGARLPNWNVTDAVVQDRITGHSIDSEELERTLAGAASILGKKLDLLGMDACFMASTELLCQIHEQADVVVASEHVVRDFGWPYTGIIEWLCHHSDMSPADLGSKIVDVCVSYYEDKVPSWPVTQCAIDCQKWTDFCLALTTLSQVLREAAVGHRSELLRAHAESFALRDPKIDYGLFDLLTFCVALSLHVTDPAVVAAAKAVEEALEPGGLVANEGHLLVPESLLDKKVPAVGGLSVYLPKPRAGATTTDLASPKGYSDLRFARDVGWDGFLSAYHEAVKNG